MKDKEKKTDRRHKDYAKQIAAQHWLDEFIRISLWDEAMNRKREYWLWERKGTHPDQNNQS